MFQLNPGDLIVLASDGILECCDASGHEYGYERLEEVISASAPPGGRTLIQRISQSVRDHTGHDFLEDDQTLIVMRIKERQPNVRPSSPDRVGIRLGHY